MIELLIAASTSAMQPPPPPAAGPPGFDMFVCVPGSTDPRCRTAPPANVDIVCPPGAIANPATGQCEFPPSPPMYVDCPSGVRVPEGQACPVVAISPSTVYFGYNNSALTDQARATLDNVVQTYRNVGQSQLVLAGHTDRSGSAAYNQRLSERYAAAVRDYLVGQGVPASAISFQGFGETRPLVDTPDGVREPQNRRVEITFGPGSGW